jgi:hypothetical protein
MKKRSSTAKGLQLGVFSKGPQNKDTIGKGVLKISLFLPKVLMTKTSLKSSDGKCRSCHQLQFRSSRGRKDQIDLSVLSYAYKQMLKVMNVILPELYPVPINR